METFRIYRMRPHVKQYFRWAPHVTGLATVKPRDYEPGAEFVAPNEYALWAELKGSEQALDVGDLVEIVSDNSSTLKICKFVGFESATWAKTEVPAETEVPAAASNADSGATRAVHSN